MNSVEFKNELISFSENLSVEADSLTPYQSKIAWDIVNRIDKLIDTLDADEAIKAQHEMKSSKRDTTNSVKVGDIRSLKASDIRNNCLDPFGEERIFSVLKRMNIDSDALPDSIKNEKVSDFLKKHNDNYTLEF